MAKQLLPYYVLFVILYQLSECGKHPEYNPEKLFQLEIKGFEKAKGLMQKAVETNIADDTADNVEDGLVKSGGPGVISKQKKLESEKTHLSKGITSAYVTTTRRPINVTSTRQTPTSIPLLPKVFLARTSLKPTEGTNKHLKKINASEIIQPKQLPPPIRERAILIRIKSAIDEVESLLQMFINMFKNAYGFPASTDMPSTQATPTTPDVPQTTAEPYPGAYQGFSPVMTGTVSSHTKGRSRNRKPGWNVIRRRRSLRNRRYSHQQAKGTRWPQIPKNYKTHHRHHYHNHRHRPKTKILISKPKSLAEILKLRNRVRTKGLQTTALNSSNCSKSCPVITDVLKTVWSMEKMIQKLGQMINRDVRKLGNQGVDSTNEERADIKTNSDRISQLQTALSGKIDEIRNNISTMMTIQRELGKGVSISLQSMMGILNQMVTMVTKRDDKIETRMKIEEKQKEGTEKSKVTTNRSNIVTKPPKTKLETPAKEVSLATKPPPSKVKSESTTKKPNLETKPPQNNEKSENATKLANILLSPRNALNITSPVKIIRPKQIKKQNIGKSHKNLKGGKQHGSKNVRKPSKKLKGRKQYGNKKIQKPSKKLKWGKQHRKLKVGNPSKTLNGSKPRKKLKGGRPRKKGKVARPSKNVKGGRPSKKVKGGRPSKKVKVGRPSKKVKGGKLHRKLKAGKPRKKLKGGIPRNKKLKGGKPRKKVKVGRPSKKVKGGRPSKKVKGGRPSKKVKVGRPSKKIKVGRPSKKVKGGRPSKKVKGGKLHRKLKAGKPSKKLKGEKPQGKPKIKKPSKKRNGGKQNVESKTGIQHKILKDVNPHGQPHSGRSDKMLKARIPHGKPRVRKPHKTQTRKPGKPRFHNDHAIVNKFKNHEYSKTKKKPVKRTDNQHIGIARSRRHGHIHTKHTRKQLRRDITKRDKKLQRLLLEELKKYEN